MVPIVPYAVYENVNVCLIICISDSIAVHVLAKFFVCVNLNFEPALILALTKIRPRINVMAKQAQSSY
jgi:hypothetical protein